MAPLVRSLLALACAALLRAACAHSNCAVSSIGELVGEELILPLVTVKESGDFDVPDNCKARNWVLQGEKAMACDWYATPRVRIRDGGATVYVEREYSVPEATLLVRQYCMVPGSVKFERIS